MNALWIEIRRSPLRWLVWLLVAIQITALFGRSTYWIGVWPQAAVAAQVPVIFTAPFLAALAAVVGGRGRTRGVVEQLRVLPRSPWAVHAAALGSVLVYGAAVYVGGQAVAAAVSLGEPGIGWLWLGYAGQGLTVVFAAVGFGYLVGVLYPSVWVGPACAGLGFFILVNILIERLDFYPLSAYLHETFMIGAYAARYALSIALVIAAVTVAVLRDEPRRGSPSRVIPAVAAAFLLVIGIFTTVNTPSLMTARSPVAPECTGTTPTICVWPENHKYLDDLSAMADRAARLSEAGLEVPAVYYESGLRPGEPGFVIIEGSMWAVAGHVAGGILMANQPNLECEWTSLSETYSLASGELSFWIEARVAGGGHRDYRGGNSNIDMDAIEAMVDSADDHTQFAWATERLATMKHESPCAR